MSLTTANSSLQLNLGVDQQHNNQYLFSDHYLDNLLPRDPSWEAALPETESFLAWLLELYASEQNQLAGYNESQLEDHWIRPILEKLGHTYEGQAAVPGLEKEIKRPDYVFFPDEAARKAAVKQLQTKLTSDPALEASIQVNPPKNARLTFDEVAQDLFEEMIEDNFQFYKQVTDEPTVKKRFFDWLFEQYLQDYTEEQESESE